MKTNSVFSGPNSLKDFYNPDMHPPLPLVEIPGHRFLEDGVHIYAKMLTLLPAANVKSLPALNMLEKAKEAGKINNDTKRIIEYSSGNTVISLAIISQIFGYGSVSAYVSNKTSTTKLQLLRFFGLEPALFGGPIQVEPSCPEGGIQASMRDGDKPGCFATSQYCNPENYNAHMRWTGPQIHKQLPKVSIFAASVGTSGTMIGTGTYLKSVNPKLVNLGVFSKAGEKVPGPRSIDIVTSLDLPWKEVLDAQSHVGANDSYMTSMELCRQGLLVGPSSGLSFFGLLQHLDAVKAAGGLEDLRDSSGMINCVFICCDQPFQYIPEYFEKLPSSAFPKIVNEELREVDKWDHGVSWKLTVTEAQAMLKDSQFHTKGLNTPPESDDGSERDSEPLYLQPSTLVLDLRDRADFDEWHIPFSLNLDMQSQNDENVFFSPTQLSRQWKELNARLEDVVGQPKGRVLVFSYDGHSATLASSILRKRGVEAYSVVGGTSAWPRV